MQRPVQFNNVSRILDETATDLRIFQEFALQCEYNSGRNSALILSQTLGLQLMFHLNQKKIFLTTLILFICIHLGSQHKEIYYLW